MIKTPLGVCFTCIGLEAFGFTYSARLLDPSVENAESQIFRRSLFNYSFYVDGQNGNKMSNSAHEQVNKNSDQNSVASLSNRNAFGQPTIDTIDMRNRL